MTKRALVVLALAGCPFAQNHPAITAGITGGAVGFTGCMVDGVSPGTCGLIGGGAALFLGGIAAIVTLLVDTDDNKGGSPDENAQEMTSRGAIRVHTKTAAPPVLVDAGVSDGVAIDAAAAVDAPLVIAIPDAL